MHIAFQPSQCSILPSSRSGFSQALKLPRDWNVSIALRVWLIIITIIKHAAHLISLPYILLNAETPTSTISSNIIITITSCVATSVPVPQRLQKWAQDNEQNTWRHTRGCFLQWGCPSTQQQQNTTIKQLWTVINSEGGWGSTRYLASTIHFSDQSKDPMTGGYGRCKEGAQINEHFRYRYGWCIWRALRIWFWVNNNIVIWKNICHWRFEWDSW